MTSSYKKNLESNSIYTNNFPTFSNTEKLEEFKRKFKLNNPSYDELYIGTGCIEYQKEYYDFLWNIFKPYADRNFLTEIKTQFLQRSWEMYIGVVLLNHGFELTNPGEGPDFILDDSIYVECIAVNKGSENSIYRVPERIQSGTAEWSPKDKIQLRLTSGIEDKFSKYKNEWSKKNWFKRSSPFIIAINSGELERPQQYPPDHPYIASVLYGVGELVFNIRREQIYFEYKNKIPKKNVEIESELFQNKEYNLISGIIYSDSRLLSAPKNGNGLLYIQNENAVNPCDQEIFTSMRKYIRQVNDNGFADWKIQR